MNPNDDPLERELQAFRPRPPSAELSRHIAAELTARPRWRLRLAFVGGLVAAGLLTAVFVMRSSVTPPQPTPALPGQLATVDVPPPTVQTYRRAMADSPEALDQLLTRQADRFGSPTAPLTINHLLYD